MNDEGPTCALLGKCWTRGLFGFDAGLNDLHARSGTSNPEFRIVEVYKLFITLETL